MTQEEKQLLLTDLCARLPYGVKCLVYFKKTKYIMTLRTGLPNIFGKWDFYNENYSICSDNFKPYLRPMSNMTEEEKHYIDYEWGADNDGDITTYSSCEGGMSIVECACIVGFQDWLNAHHFDYRGLIPKGLALEAPEGMY